MMRRLQLNFVQVAHSPTWFGPVLLAAGLLCSVAVAVDFAQAHELRNRLQAQQADALKLMRREQPQLQRPMGDPNLAAKELDYARLILSDLSRPWDAMFAELERAASRHVALLGVQPGASGTEVRLRGEARSYDDLLEYIVRLENTERFGDVLLTAHEEQKDGGIRFALTAKWIRTS